MLREIYSSLSQIFISTLLKYTFPIVMRIHFKFCNDESFNLKRISFWGFGLDLSYLLKSITSQK